jgi:hypothetical protein
MSLKIENSRRVAKSRPVCMGLIALLFFSFLPLSKIEKSAKNGRKVKAIALLFGCFFPLFQKLKNRLKMDEK